MRARRADDILVFCYINFNILVGEMSILAIEEELQGAS